MKKRSLLLGLASLTPLALAACHHAPTSAAYYEPSADSTESNRLLIRMALEENVYNGVVTERAVYAKDFRPGTAELNPLGRRRVDTLIDASRTARGEIAVLRGDERDDVYADRIIAVRHALNEAGIKDVTVGRADDVGGAGVSSDRAVLTYTKLMSEYAPKATNTGGSSSSANSGSTTTTNNPSGAKGQ
jgi:hypothetical protein